jgi:hypothetical protein
MLAEESDDSGATKAKIPLISASGNNKYVNKFGFGLIFAM